MESMLHHLTRQGTATSPTLFLDRDAGTLDISGQSYPEDAFSFYSPIVEGFRQFLMEHKGTVSLRIMLDYFNTSSSKYLRALLEVLEECHRAGNQAKAIWYFDLTDPEMEEAGHELMDGLTVPFETVGVER